MLLALAQPLTAPLGTALVASLATSIIKVPHGTSILKVFSFSRGLPANRDLRSRLSQITACQTPPKASRKGYFSKRAKAGCDRRGDPYAFKEIVTTETSVRDGKITVQGKIQRPGVACNNKSIIKIYPIP